MRGGNFEVHSLTTHASLASCAIVSIFVFGSREGAAGIEVASFMIFWTTYTFVVVDCCMYLHVHTADHNADQHHIAGAPLIYLYTMLPSNVII